MSFSDFHHFQPILSRFIFSHSDRRADAAAFSRRLKPLSSEDLPSFADAGWDAFSLRHFASLEDASRCDAAHFFAAEDDISLSFFSVFIPVLLIFVRPSDYHWRLRRLIAYFADDTAWLVIKMIDRFISHARYFHIFIDISYIIYILHRNSLFYITLYLFIFSLYISYIFHCYIVFFIETYISIFSFILSYFYFIIFI